MAQQHDLHASVDSSSHLNPFNPLSDVESKPVPAFAQESRQHQTLHSKLMNQERNGKQAGAYVSPSDNIMSPASAKLNAFKERRFVKSAKPRTLFSTIPSRPACTDFSEQAPGFDKPAAQSTKKD